MSDEQTQEETDKPEAKTICARELHLRTGATLQDVAVNGASYVVTLHGRIIAVMLPVPAGIEGYILGRALDEGLIEIEDDGSVANGKTAEQLLAELREHEATDAADGASS